MATQLAIPLATPKKKMYGLLHEAGTDRAIVREVRSLKVGIGQPAGPDLHAYIGQSGKWKIILVDKVAGEYETMDECRAAYRKFRETAPVRNYPKRLAYFTFTHIGQEGLFEPDWTMIEAHGPVPTEIDIVFLSDDPFEAQYQMWSTSELRCYGDGVTGARTFAMAATAEEKELARQADAVGLRYFPIIDGCWTKDCPYSKPTEKNGKEFPSACRPHGRLVFQLIASPRLGSTAYFDTTGMRSISQIFSCLQAFKTATGAGNVEKGFVAGIPLTMVVRPYRTKKGTQYGVALEFRAETASQLKAQLVKHGVEFRMAAQLTDGPRMISPPVAGELEALTDDDEDEAARQSAEFYPQAQRSTAELVATKTEQATDALAARLSGGTPARASEREGAASVTAAAPAQTTPVTPSARTLASGAPPATEEFF